MVGYLSFSRIDLVIQYPMLFNNQPVTMHIDLIRALSGYELSKQFENELSHFNKGEKAPIIQNDQETA